MRRLSFYRSPRHADSNVTQYCNPHTFWNDWNGLLGHGMWHRTDLDPNGNPYTVKWSSSAYLNGYGEQAVHTSALWVDGEHAADTRPPAPQPHEKAAIPATQLGRANAGERLRSPHGTWTITESWIAEKPGADSDDRDYRSRMVSRGSHVYYLLTHEDGHQEEWSAPDMADADFHRILDNQQQTLTE